MVNPSNKQQMIVVVFLFPSAIRPKRYVVHSAKLKQSVAFVFYASCRAIHYNHHLNAFFIAICESIIVVAIAQALENFVISPLHRCMDFIALTCAIVDSATCAASTWPMPTLL